MVSSISADGTQGWQSPALAAGFVNVGSSWQICQYRTVGDTVYLRGLVAKTGGLGVIFTVRPLTARARGGLLYAD